MKVNDIVVCISNKSVLNESLNLTSGKKYIVHGLGKDRVHNLIYIIDDSDELYGYYEHRFINLMEQRRLKLDKLNTLV